MELSGPTAVLLGCALAASAQAPRIAVSAASPTNRALIWVLQPDNRLAVYDAAGFRSRGTLSLPPEAKGDPERLSISRQGAVMVTYPPGENVSLRRVWQSDPRLGSALVGGADGRTPEPGGGFLITSAVPEVRFSSDPERVFWFQNHKQVLRRDGVEISVNTRFQAWTSDRQGESVRQILEIRFPQCACETGVCEESCPEAKVWAPESGITDFFFVTRWVPGQLQPDFRQTGHYRLRDGRWTGQKLPAPVEQFADMAGGGDVFIEVVNDGSCCGWENVSNDQARLVRKGQSTVIYDERERFRNDNYDVSFLTPRVRLSPDGARIAYTLAATALPGAEIRLSDSGKDNPEELQRVRKLIAAMPRVEVQAVANPKKVIAELAGELVDWLDAGRILAVQAGELVVLDVTIAARTSTGIKATAARNVFVR
jgi:hypothetical protein